MATKVKPPEAEPEDPAEQAVQESLRRAQQLFASGTGKTLDLLREADRNLSERLHKEVAKRGSRATFTAASAEIYRKQVETVTAYLEKRLAGHTHEQATKAIRVSVRATVKVAKAFETRFSGITKPLALDSQHQQDETVKGTAQSLLRRHQSSVARYGKAMVGDFEQTIRKGLIEGLSQQQMVSRMVESGKHGRVSAKTLHANEPGYFPKPTSYVRRRYWAERIVRTEVAQAQNSAALAAMTVTRANDMPDMQKRILAMMGDPRTAPDSIAVHGQVRKLEEMFVDGCGRQYLHPPGRPNDRETIIPWRPRWKDTKSTAPLPASEQAAAAVAAQAQAATADERRERLRQAMAAAKGRLEEKRQATAAAQGVAKAKAQKVERVKAARAARKPGGEFLVPLTDVHLPDAEGMLEPVEPTDPRLRRLARQIQKAADTAIAGKSISELGALPLDEGPGAAASRDKIEAFKKDPGFLKEGLLPSNNDRGRGGLPSFTIEANGRVYLNNGRHRVTAAIEAKVPFIVANLKKYDAKGDFAWDYVGPVRVAPQHGPKAEAERKAAAREARAEATRQKRKARAK